MRDPGRPLRNASVRLDVRQLPAVNPEDLPLAPESALLAHQMDDRLGVAGFDWLIPLRGLDLHARTDAGVVTVDGGLVDVDGHIDRVNGAEASHGQLP